MRRHPEYASTLAAGCRGGPVLPQWTLNSSRTADKLSVDGNRMDCMWPIWPVEVKTPLWRWRRNWRV